MRMNLQSGIKDKRKLMHGAARLSETRCKTKVSMCELWAVPECFLCDL